MSYIMIGVYVTKMHSFVKGLCISVCMYFTLRKRVLLKTKIMERDVGNG